MNKTRRTRFAIIGGYLGSGKTTLATALAKELKERYGKSTAIVTNDQGNVLVDTQYVKDAGFDVAEVLGGCFCSKFPEFVKNARTLVAMGRPDVIIAEPIGTSTNVLSSVVAPLRSIYPDEFEVAPLVVVVDGTRGEEMLERPTGFGLGSKSRIIPLNQVHDAEVILVSKCDLISKRQVEDVVKMLETEAPGAEIIPYSARTSTNIDRIVQLMVSTRQSQKQPRPDDPAIFAVEKASMGWYNLAGKLYVTRLDLSDFVTSMLREVAEAFPSRMMGHVKLIVTSPGAAVKMSLVEGQIQVEGLRGGRYLQGEGRMVVNARINTSPEEMRRVFDGAVTSSCKRFQVELTEKMTSCFSPRPEVPDHLKSK